MIRKTKLLQAVVTLFLTAGIMVVPAHAESPDAPARPATVTLPTSTSGDSGLDATDVVRTVRNAMLSDPHSAGTNSIVDTDVTSEIGVTPDGGLWANRFGNQVAVIPMVGRQEKRVKLDNFMVVGNFVARASANSVQSLAVLATKKTPAPSWRLSLPPDTRAVVQEDGSVLFLKVADGSVTVLDQYLKSPWAVDATGRLLPTHYEVTDNLLVQHVDTTGAKFPVVSDPRLTFGWGIYLNMRGYELKMAAIAITAAGGATVIAVCSGIANLPGVLATIAKVVCTAVGSATLRQIWIKIVEIARTITDDGACYQSKISVNPITTFKKVDARNC